LGLLGALVIIKAALVLRNIALVSRAADEEGEEEHTRPGRERLVRLGDG
jgi:hypothetical protein